MMKHKTLATQIAKRWITSACRPFTTMSSKSRSRSRQVMGSSVNWSKLQPNDVVSVYHGTLPKHVASMINGFDATAVQRRLFNQQPHPGLYVTPDFKTARGFGAAIMELRVRAKNLHGTDYGGNIGRNLHNQDPETQIWLHSKFPNSFRPYLSMTMTQTAEPQALLIGLVAPRQITRVYYKGDWYTRKEFINLGSQEVDPPKVRLFKDIGYDMAKTTRTFDEFVSIASEAIGRDPKQVIKAFTRLYEREPFDEFVYELQQHFGFGEKAAYAFATKFQRHLSANRIASRLLSQLYPPLLNSK